MKPTRCCLMLSLAIGAALLCATPSMAAHHRHPTASVQQQKPPFNQAVLDAEVMLARNAFRLGLLMDAMATISPMPCMRFSR